jgi:hypothetical protein
MGRSTRALILDVAILSANGIGRRADPARFGLKVFDRDAQAKPVEQCSAFGQTLAELWITF